MNEGVVEIWNNEKAGQWFMHQLLKKNKEDYGFFDESTEKYHSILKELRKFVNDCFKGGIGIEEIKLSLLGAGWNENTINKIIKEKNNTEQPQEITKELKEFVKQNIEQGISIEKIKSNLLKAGWNENTINKVIANFTNKTSTQQDLSTATSKKVNNQNPQDTYLEYAK